MQLSNKAYKVLKWMALYLFPAMGTLYFALSGIWNLPYGEQIVGTITAFDTFLGVILGISTAQYNKTNKQHSAQWQIKREGLAKATTPLLFYSVHNPIS